MCRPPAQIILSTTVPRRGRREKMDADMRAGQEPRAAPEDLKLAREFARQLRSKLNRADFTVKLFGSRATGEADAESDLDLFVALDWDDPQERVKGVALDIACDLTLAHGMLVAVFVADRRFLEDHSGFSFLETVEAEGVRV